MCVVPYIAFYVSVCYFTKTRSNLLWFWWLQNLAVHTNTYMLHDQLFLILSHLFFHNAIALPVLKFIFNSVKCFLIVQEAHVHILLFLQVSLHSHSKIEYSFSCTFAWNKPTLWVTNFFQDSWLYSAGENKQQDFRCMAYEAYGPEVCAFCTFGFLWDHNELWYHKSSGHLPVV